MYIVKKLFNILMSLRAKCGDRQILKTAFTLAEVLITLLIIGVVAGIVVPNLIQDTQQAEFIAAWKKSYGVIMQAQLNLVRDNGSIIGSFSNVYYTKDSGNAFMNTWLQYMSVFKTCSAGRIFAEQCHNTPFLAFDGSTVPNYNNGNAAAGAILSDGTFINFYPGVCSGTVCSDTFLFIDVNGTKGPNTYGKDVFRLKYDDTKDRFTPGAPICSGAGWTCGAYYLFH